MLDLSQENKPVMHKFATNPKVRDCFYHRARVSAADRIAVRLAGKKLFLIGDAIRLGKSEAPILSTFEAAFGISEPIEECSVDNFCNSAGDKR